MWLCILLLLFSALNIRNQHEIQEFTIHSLEKIAGRVLWDESELSISFQNSINEVEEKNLGTQIKLLSLKNTNLPEGMVPLVEFFKQCQRDDVFEYSYLPTVKAKELLHAFAEEDGSIYDKKEDMAGVERFWFSGHSSKSTHSDPVLVTTKLVKGANVNSDFTSLSDLNESIFLAYLNTGFQNNDVWPTSINWKLKTSAGSILIHMPFKINLERKDGEVLIDRYVGVCIPKYYFFSAEKI